jgi:magnesium transporter
MSEVINNVSKNENITFNNELINELILHSGNRNSEKLNKLIEDLHPADLADLLTFLNSEQRSYTLSILDEETYTNVLAELDDTIIDETIQKLEDKKVVRSISEMETDDAVNLIESLEPEAQKKLLDQVPTAEREIFEESLNYPEDSAGRRMQKEFVSMPAFWTVGQAIDYLRVESDLPDDFFEIFIVDPLNKPLGSVSVSKVLRSARKTQLNGILDDSPKFIKASMDQEEAALLFEQYSLVSAGVVDDQDRLIGRITADDIVWVLQEEAEEDILRLGGVSETEMNQSIVKSTKKRFIWLFLNLLTAILASVVISLFDASIEKMVALAILMPIVASMGGNAGTQTLTLTVRSLATKELVDTNRRKVFIKEISISILNGFIFAVLTSLATILWFNDSSLALIVGAAMIINIFSAGLFGFLIPYSLNYFKIDPALASSVFVTTVTDVFGFLSFLGLASLFLFN